MNQKNTKSVPGKLFVELESPQPLVTATGKNGKEHDNRGNT